MAESPLCDGAAVSERRNQAWTLASVNTRAGALIAVLHGRDGTGLDEAVAEMRALAMIGTAGDGTDPPWAVEFAGPRTGGRVRGLGHIRNQLQACGLSLRQVKIAILQICEVRTAVRESARGHKITVLANAGKIARAHVSEGYSAGRTLVQGWEEARKAGQARPANKHEITIHGAIAMLSERGVPRWSGTLWMHGPHKSVEMREDAKTFFLATIATVRAMEPNVTPMCEGADAIIETSDPRSDNAETVWAYAYRTLDAQAARRLRMEKVVDEAMYRTLAYPPHRHVHESTPVRH